MEPIFDFLGQTVGWLEDGIAYDGNGLPVVFLQEGAVFAAENGHYLGQSDGGVFRDGLGCIVAFVRGTRCFTVFTRSPDGRLRPSIRSRAVPGRAHPSASPPRRADPLLNRSSLDWERFITEGEAHWPWATRC